jgi:hypothetical protein
MIESEENKMTEAMKKNSVLSMDDLDGVAGGSSKETISDGQCIRAMLNLKTEPTPDVIQEAFEKGGVSVKINTGNKANIYTFQGRRISRYEALVRLGRGNGKGSFDITPYLADSHGDNNDRHND